LTPLTHEVISRQATINIGLIFCSRLFSAQFLRILANSLLHQTTSLATAVVARREDDFFRLLKMSYSNPVLDNFLT